MAMQLPASSAALHLHRDGDTLYVTELSNSEQPPSPQLLKELREQIDSLAAAELKLEAPVIQRGAAASNTTRIRHIVCQYETQTNDELVEQKFKLTLHNATELTVPHTRWGLVAHAIGAFLPRCTRLRTLFVHTCDHTRLRETIVLIPSLRLTVIRNDSSNGFWNTASLALFARLRSNDLVERPNGYNAVVVAHTNATEAFSAAEWALATYLFMRNQPYDAKSDDDANNPNLPVNGRAILHDFGGNDNSGADDMGHVFAAAFAVVYSAAETSEPVWRAATNRFWHIGIRQHAQRRIEYSFFTRRTLHFASRGRNAFIPYIAQFGLCRAGAVRVGNGPFWAWDEVADGIRLDGAYMHQRDTGEYGVIHELLFVVFRERLNCENVHIRETSEIASQSGLDRLRAARVIFTLAAKLRACAPLVFPSVTARCGRACIPATRMLLLGCAVERLELEMKTLTAKTADGACELINNLNRLDHLTLSVFGLGANTIDRHADGQQLGRVLDAALSAPCGILGLRIRDLDSRIANACVTHIMRRTEPCLLLALSLDVYSGHYRDEDHHNDIVLENLLAANMATGAVLSQLVSLTITTPAYALAPNVRMRCLPGLIAACTNLQHLSVNLRMFTDADRHQVQASILRAAGTLKTLQFWATSDSQPDGSSFTAQVLLRMQNAVFVSIDVDSIPKDINGVADALVLCLARPTAEHLTVTCRNNERFQASRLRSLRDAARQPGSTNNVGLRFQAQFDHDPTDAAQSALGGPAHPSEIVRERMYLSAPAPTTNSAYIDASIEDECRKLKAQAGGVVGTLRRLSMDADARPPGLQNQDARVNAMRTREATATREVSDAALQALHRDAETAHATHGEQPVVLKSAPVRVTTTRVRPNLDRPNRGKGLPFVRHGELMPPTRQLGLEIESLVPWAGPAQPPRAPDLSMAAYDTRYGNDPRGNLVSMSQPIVDAVAFLLSLEQTRRVVWLLRISRKIRDSPQTTIDTHDFAPEVQMAATRASYQAGRDMGLNRTHGCTTFGSFFDQTGFPLQGFPTPGGRPQDATSELRHCRYGADLVPGQRQFVLDADATGRQLTVMAPQVDQFGRVFGNENVQHGDFPERYASLPRPIPIVQSVEAAINGAIDANGFLCPQVDHAVQNLQNFVNEYARGLARQLVHLAMCVCIADFDFGSAPLHESAAGGGGLKRRALALAACTRAQRRLLACLLSFASGVCVCAPCSGKQRNVAVVVVRLRPRSGRVAINDSCV
jgi:hypothetical protein